MRFCVLGSGSKGNCTYVTANDTSILIDAGFSGVEIESRLANIGAKAAELSAILVTHEHGDHVRGVAVLSRRFNIPVYANKPTVDAAGKYLQKLYTYKPFSTGTPFKVNHLDIHPFAVSHDTADPVGFTIDDGISKMGYCTDTGTISKLIYHHLSTCRGIVIECNHDLEMLRNGHYPVHVQQRVRSQCGHLANPQAIELLGKLSSENLEKVILAHISESNNCHKMIEKNVADLLKELGEKKLLNGRPLSVSLASQDKVGEVVVLGK